MVTMKVVSRDLIVVDNKDNSVGFLNASSLSELHTQKYSAEGYLNCALGCELYGKQSIYLCFSSGRIILVDAISFKQLAYFDAGE